MPLISIRPARRADATFLAPLFDAAGGGIPAHYWARTALPGQSPMDVGVARIRRDDTPISWRLTWVADCGASRAGCLVIARLADEPEPLADDLPPLAVPLQQLEDLAAGTGHLHMIATAPEYRGQGVGDALMTFADTMRGPRGLSLIVADANLAARRLYQRHGYHVAATRAMIKEDWPGDGTEWLLMTKP